MANPIHWTGIGTQGIPRPEYGGYTPELNRLRDAAAGGDPALAAGTAAQQAAMRQYGQILAGGGPTVAGQQLQQGLAQAQTQAMQLAGQTRGGNIASAEQAAMAAQTGLQQQGVMDAAQLRAMEQQQAIAGLGGMGAQLAGQGLEQNLGYEQLLAGGQLGQMDAQLQSQLGNRELDLKARDDRHKRIQNWVKTGSNVVGSILAAIFSDERVKEGVRPSAMQATEAVAASDPVQFRYKPGFGPYGMRIGTTAQSLERTPAGAQIVRTDPNTGAKMVDVGGLASLNHAAMAETLPRVDQLEQRLAALEGGGSPTAPRGGGQGGGRFALADALAAVREARLARSQEQGGSTLTQQKVRNAMDTGSALAGDGSALSRLRERMDRGYIDDDTQKTGGLLAGLFGGGGRG